MRSFWRKSVTALLAASMTVSTVVPNGIVTANAAETVDATVKLTPASASVFNDTDGDGLGEFQGWGTSLCWWANRIGYSDKLTEKAADAFYGDGGLRMNIGRYNIGGGDNVGEIEEVSENENADIYDLSSDILPTFSGSSMKISSSSSYSSATYSQSDADFGITAGNTVGTIQTIGWINALNADAGSGGNLHYTIPVEKSGKYTIKMLFTLAGSNSRGVSMQVTNDGTDSENKMETTNTYTVEADDVNSDIIASSGNNNIYRVTFTDVELAEGDNKIDIGGAGSDWCLDYIKMAVIESGKEGTLPETSDFYHASHITRSDAAVPGYATDVTKIDLDEHDKEYYEDNFARADFECGYAWNYDWDADSNQFNVLLAAAEKSGEDFIAEAFSNSPPYFMTESGCSSGNIDANEDNLREDSYTAFATYLADIIAHWKEEGIVDFESVDAMNEPYTDYWGAYSNKQE
nr:xylosidase/arabinofuranosidase [Lachnospiraceae bacterium]